MQRRAAGSSAPNDPPHDDQPVVWWTQVINPYSLRFANRRHEVEFALWHATCHAQAVDMISFLFSTLTFLWFVAKVHVSQSLQECIMVGMF